MYLPLTGYNKDDKRGTKMKVGAVTSQVVAPTRPGQGVQSQNQEVNNQQGSQQPAPQEQGSVTSDKLSSHNSKSGMSTEDFLQLHNSSAQDMAESIKDVMALKVMEKALEVIDKIVSDWLMEVGDLVQDKTMPGSQGIIVEVKSSRNVKSKTTYITYLVHWFDTEFKSTHGPNQLALIS